MSNFSESNSSFVQEPGPESPNAYLMKHFAVPLKEALREIVIKKPLDPVEFLGCWLLHYKDCKEKEEKLKECEAELSGDRYKIRSKLDLLFRENEDETEHEEEADDP